jgi:hypothetical protein
MAPTFEPTSEVAAAVVEEDEAAGVMTAAKEAEIPTGISLGTEIGEMIDRHPLSAILNEAVIETDGTGTVVRAFEAGDLLHKVEDAHQTMALETVLAIAEMAH